MLRARLNVTTAAVRTNRVVAPTLPDKLLFSGRIVGKHLEYLFEGYSLAEVFARSVHILYLFAGIVYEKLTGKCRKLNYFGTFLYNSHLTRSSKLATSFVILYAA